MCRLGTFQRLIEVPATRPLYGLRRWWVDPRGGLRAIRLVRPPLWRPGVNAAAGRIDPWTDRGFWAYARSPEGRARFAGHMPWRVNGYYVCGAVALWGRVAVHAYGYRASRARVVALTGFSTSWAGPIGTNGGTEAQSARVLTRLRAAYRAKARLRWTLMAGGTRERKGRAP